MSTSQGDSSEASDSGRDGGSCRLGGPGLDEHPALRADYEGVSVAPNELEHKVSRRANKLCRKPSEVTSLRVAALAT